MLRLRLVTFPLVASLGLVCGCMNLSNHPWLSGLRGNSSRDCCDMGACCDVGGICCDGPVLPETGGVPVGPPPGAVISPPLSPQNGVPTLTPAPQPRLVPQPQTQGQAPATPYTPGQ